MKAVETAIVSRLTGDSTLQSLLGGAGRIYHAMESGQAKKPSLTFMLINASPGSINSDRVQTMEETYQFMIFADNYVDIAYRLRRLLDGYQFADGSEAGSISAVWESEGADAFDEPLEVGRKDVQFKVMLMPVAVGDI